MLQKLTPEEQKKQESYRDARVSGDYDKIWQSVNKCVFCDLNPKYIFNEENGIVMTISLYAYIDGHFMIVPRRHIRSVKEFTPAEWETVRKFMYIAKKIIKQVHGIKGMQTLLKEGETSQSTVGHIHFHCIPFDSADLSEWHYRKLKNTPIENALIYRSHLDSIAKLSAKFDVKYLGKSLFSSTKKVSYQLAVKQALDSKKASKAKKTAKVGASIISGKQIISTCNANLAVGPIEVEKNGIWVSPPTVAHAEERIIAQAAKDGVSTKGATMIVTLSPCMACSRQIVNSGIKELHYIDAWWDQKALDFLANNGVKVIKLKPKGLQKP
jgi:dCMP deaminase